MGSAAITAAAASTDDPVRQGYINMTGTFWDTIVVCTITGLCIASSGVLGTTDTSATGTYIYESQAETGADPQLNLSLDDGKSISNKVYIVSDFGYDKTAQAQTMDLVLGTEKLLLVREGEAEESVNLVDPELVGTWKDESGNEYIFSEDGKLEYRELVVGSALTIASFKTVLGAPGGWLVCIAIALFAFSTILGWEYHGEKAFEYLFKTHKFNIVYRVIFSLVVYLGATTTLKIAWNFSDIANALMAIPNLICMLALSGVIVEEMNRYQKVIEAEKAAKKK